MKRVIVVVLVCFLSLVSFYEISLETSAHNEKTINVTFIFNDQFIIDDGIGPIIYTDVIQEPDISDPNPDIILITHDHNDHFDPIVVAQMANSHGSTVVGPNSVIDALEGSVPLGQLIRMDPLLYEKMNQTIQGMEIFAYHGSVDNNSYGFRVGNGVISVYHSGDNIESDFDQYISNGYTELYDLNIAMLAGWSFNLDNFNTTYHPDVMIKMHEVPMWDRCEVYENYPDYTTLLSEDTWQYLHIPMVDIVYGTTPSIDGIITPGEWDDANSIMFFNKQGEIEIYFKHDNSSLYFMSHIMDSTYYWGDDIVIGIDTEHNGGTNPQLDDYQFYIRRDVSTSEINRGTKSGWESVPASEWGGHVSNETSSDATTWTAEISISYAFLNITDSNQIMGIEFRNYDDNPQGWYNWPADGGEDEPDTWAQMQSSDNWGLEDASNILYVGGSGSGNYTHIQYAVDNATHGDTVYVYDDSSPYNERVVVDKSISLTGENRDLTIIDGGGIGNVVTVTADFVNISGLTVRNSGSDFENAGIRLESDNISITNIIILDSNIGIYSFDTNRTIVVNNSITANVMAGIFLAGSIGATITENEMTDCGIIVGGDLLAHWNSHIINTSNTINGAPVIYWKDRTQGTTPPNAGQVILANCSNVIVENQDINQVYAGIELGFSSNNYITNNTILNNGLGAFIISSHQNNITNNIISSSQFVNIVIRDSNDNRLINNQINSCQWLEGIQMADSNSNTFRDNTFNFNSGGGVRFRSSQTNILINNTITSNSDYGLYLSDTSQGNEIRGNTISSNTYHGMYILDSDSNYIYDNDASNNNIDGILLENSHDCDIIKNVLTQNGFFGMSFLNSDNNLLADSDLSSNNYYGLEIEDSWQNDIVNNTFGNNERGIYIHGTSLFNNIFYNNITDNTEYGIYIYSSSPMNNVIYNNNFFNNAEQARDDTDDSNMWDNRYPTGGNYWNDYTGVDEYSGEDQNQPGGDGIGDTDYMIDSNSIDHYPLMGPFGTAKGPVYNMDKDLYYYKIQEAIDDADFGNTIFVSRGTYYENLVLDKTINLTGEDRNDTIINGLGTGDVINIKRDYVKINGFYITNSGSKNEDAGIKIDSNENMIFGNIITHNRMFGIKLNYSEGSNIYDNVISNNSGDGIRITGSKSNIFNNTISYNKRGIYVFFQGNIIENNTIIENNWGGISLTFSSNNVILNNRFVLNGITMVGTLANWTSQIIDTSNIVNGRAVYYLKNLTSGVVPDNAGQIILANCSNVNVANQNIYNTDTAISLGYSSNCLIIDNLISNNSFGITMYESEQNYLINNTIQSNGAAIALFGCDDNLVENNNIDDNVDYGLRLSYSQYNKVSANQISDSSNGIYLEFEQTRYNIIQNNTITNISGEAIYSSHSNNITIANNTISNNGEGILLISSDNFVIYHNNFNDNINQAYDDENTNQWDNGYPDGGNYWSDYSGVDDFSGPNQDQPGKDGIGDIYYEIDPDSRDNYPLIVPYGTPLPINSPPSVIDITFSNQIALIESRIYIHINASDLEDSEGILIPIIQWQYNNSAPSGVWSSDYINNSDIDYIGGSSPDGWLSVPFEPTVMAQIGHYDFRVKVRDTENNESENPQWIYSYQAVYVISPAPTLHDIILRHDEVYRGESLYITLNATDPADSESELTLQIQFKLVLDSVWTNIPNSSISYDYPGGGYWLIEFKTNYSSQLGDCEFRGRVHNSGGYYSNGGAWNVPVPESAMILNNKPIASNIRTLGVYSVERGSSIDILFDGEDLEDIPEDLTPFIEYRSESGEWEDLYLLDLILPDGGSNTWRITFYPPSDYGFPLGRYHFRVWFEDSEGDIGDAHEVQYFVEVLNVIPIIDDLSCPQSGYRKQTFYLTANCSDIDYSEDMLTPVFQYKSPSGDWVGYGDSESFFKNQASYNNDCWQIAFKPTIHAELGYYDFRVQFQDEIEYSQWFIIDDTFLIKNNEPIAKIKEPDSGEQSTTTIRFEAEASDIEDSILNYEWDFGDDSGISTEESPTYTFSEGTWIITLTATDSDGDTVSDTITITIPIDTDEDGEIDDLDYDDDNDGLSDDEELDIGTDPKDPDSDDDGFDDLTDVFPADKDEWLDTDDDGIGDNEDEDDDDDGLTDLEEMDLGTDPLNFDTDDDGYYDPDDFYPLDSTKWEEPEKDSDFNYMILLIVMVLLIVSIASVLLINNKKKSSKMQVPVQPSYSHPALPQSPQINQPLIQITCPQCRHSFNITNTGGLAQIQCPNCGVAGTANLGGNVPLTPPAASAPTPTYTPPQEIRCPGCQNLFRVETATRPITIQCPHCGITGTLN